MSRPYVDFAYSVPGGTVGRTSPDRWNDRVNIKDFGAIGDGVADDTAAIQSAIDYAFQNKKNTVYCPQGMVCRTTDTIHVGYGAGTVQNFNCMWLESDHVNYLDPTYGAFRIQADFVDRPIINIQGARSSGIRNLFIEVVPSRYPECVALGGSMTMEQRATIAAYKPAGCADSRNAPFCGVCIDGYASFDATPASIPATPYPTPDYPAFLGTVDMTTGAYNRSKSSQFYVMDCVIQCCNIGVCCKPNDDGNGDFMNVRGCVFQYLKIAVSIGNSQARSNDFSNLNIFMVHTIFDSLTHSMSSNGYVAGTYDNLHYNYVYRVFNIAANWSTPFICTNWYSESSMRLGDFTAAGTIKFQGCIIDCRDTDGIFLGGDIWCEPVATNLTATFEHCRFVYMKSAFHFRGGSVTFKDCGWQLAHWEPPHTPGPEMTALKAMGTVFTDLSITQIAARKSSMIDLCVAAIADVGGRIDIDTVPGFKCWHANGMSAPGINHDYDIPNFTRMSAGGYDSLSWSGRNLVGTWWPGYNFQPGDLIFSERATGGSLWLFVTSYDNATGAIVLTAISGFKKVGGVYTMFNTAMITTPYMLPSTAMQMPVLGDKFMKVTEGSAVVQIVDGNDASVARPTEITVTSRPLYHASYVIESYGKTIIPFPTGTIISSVAANSFTMNQNALVSGIWRMCPGFVKLK